MSLTQRLIIAHVCYRRRYGLMGMLDGGFYGGAFWEKYITVLRFSLGPTDQHKLPEILYPVVVSWVVFNFASFLQLVPQLENNEWTRRK